MQEVFLEVRERGIPVSSYIDDGLTADLSYERCLWAVVLIIRLLVLLGAFFGLPKCRFRPSQEGEWLGFEMITQEEKFQVLARKMAKVKAVLERIRGVETGHTQTAGGGCRQAHFALACGSPRFLVLEDLLPSYAREA
jgi:hypothetical protein